MEHEFPQRAAWHAFPDVLICAPESDVKNHPDYEQAKEGNLQDSAPAAKRLSSDMVPVKAVAALRLVTPAAAKLVPVHALEHQGINRIPAALAELLGEALGVPVETSIIQVNVVNHTGASGWHRMSSPPLFDGAVDRNRPYVLVDDFIGQGGTLANLRGHVMHHGGTVVGAICLTGRADSAKLALSNQTLDSLRRKHGPEIEEWWRENLGYDFSCLTESEARYLLRVEDADTIRARIREARSARDH
jgi:hypothetical protein